MNSVDLSFTITWQSSTSGETAFSSSSSFEPDAVLVGASSGIIREPLLLLLSNVVSANRLVCAIFSMTLPPVVKSAKFGFLAALCFFARILSACVSFAGHGQEEEREREKTESVSEESDDAN